MYTCLDLHSEEEYATRCVPRQGRYGGVVHLPKVLVFSYSQLLGAVSGQKKSRILVGVLIPDYQSTMLQLLKVLPDEDVCELASLLRIAAWIPIPMHEI